MRFADRFPPSARAWIGRRALVRMPLACALLVLGACAPTVQVSRGDIKRDPDINDASGRLSDLSSPLERVRRPVPIKLVFRGTDARGGFLVEGVDTARIAEQNCKEWFVCSGDYDHPGRSNYWVLNREYMKQVAEEAGPGGSQVPGANFEVRLSVGLVERDLRSDGSKSEYKLVVFGGSDLDRQRQGAVEVRATVIDCITQRELYAETSYGDLMEIERGKGMWHYFGGGESSTRIRTSLPDAIRAATHELAGSLDAFFGKYLDDPATQRRESAASSGSGRSGTARPSEGQALR